MTRNKQNNVDENLRYSVVTEDFVKCFIRDVLSGIKYMDGLNFFHRDVKLENILYIEEDNMLKFKICDYGLTRPTDISRTNGRIGTPNYMAPECIKKGVRVRAKSDIWALGLCVYFLIQRKLPEQWTNCGNIQALFHMLRNLKDTSSKIRAVSLPFLGFLPY